MDLLEGESSTFYWPQALLRPRFFQLWAFAGWEAYAILSNRSLPPQQHPGFLMKYIVVEIGINRNLAK
jgi:hypothetical protein